jgi:hypothetical protein
MCALDYAKEGVTSLAEVIRLAGGLEGRGTPDLELSISDS